TRRSPPARSPRCAVPFRRAFPQAVRGGAAGCPTQPAGVVFAAVGRITARPPGILLRLPEGRRPRGRICPAPIRLTAGPPTHCCVPPDTNACRPEPAPAPGRERAVADGQ